MRWKLHPRVSSAGLLLVTFLGGSAFGSLATSEMSAETAPQAAPPGYIIGVTRSLSSDPDALGPYRDAAWPLARAAGLSYVARGPEVHVLEGEWPFEGTLLVEQYSSLQAILDFWYSPGYQEAKKLRADFVDVDFLIAVEGVAP